MYVKHGGTLPETKARVEASANRLAASRYQPLQRWMLHYVLTIEASRNLLTREARRLRIVPGYRDMAQLGSALDWGSRGRKFKSCYPDENHGGMH